MFFRWRGQLRRVRRAEGPERLAEEWWRRPPGETGAAHVRDYYRVEDDAGARFWLFRAGLYGGDVTPEMVAAWAGIRQLPSLPPSPSWGGTGRKAARVGKSRKPQRNALVSCAKP